MQWHLQSVSDETDKQKSEAVGHCITLLFSNDQWQRRKHIKHMSWNLSKNDLSLDFWSIVPRVRQSMVWEQISDRLNTYFKFKRKLTKIHVKP